MLVGTHDGPIASVDLALVAYRVVLEYEGDQHRTDTRQWDYDVRRYEDLTAAGFIVLRITARRFRNPREVVTSTYERLCERGYSGPPPVFDQAWQDLFESSVHFIH